MSCANGNKDMGKQGGSAGASRRGAADAAHGLWHRLQPLGRNRSVADVAPPVRTLRDLREGAIDVGERAGDRARRRGRAEALDRLRGSLADSLAEREVLPGLR